jgi:hypothetical protein
VVIYIHFDSLYEGFSGTLFLNKSLKFNQTFQFQLYVLMIFLKDSFFFFPKIK